MTPIIPNTAAYDYRYSLAPNVCGPVIPLCLAGHLFPRRCQEASARVSAGPHSGGLLAVRPTAAGGLSLDGALSCLSLGSLRAQLHGPSVAQLVNCCFCLRTRDMTEGEEQNRTPEGVSQYHSSHLQIWEVSLHCFIVTYGTQMSLGPVHTHRREFHEDVSPGVEMWGASVGGGEAPGGSMPCAE